MGAAGHFRIRLAKEDFKFAAAHFTLFPDGRAELLHGHNYRVGVELAGARLDDFGLLIDFATVKQAIRAACAELDERTLIPRDAAVLRIAEAGDHVEVACAERRYRFPSKDVVLLPLANSSVELLSRLLWTAIAPSLAGSPVEELAVWVEETAGQACTYAAPLPPL